MRFTLYVSSYIAANVCALGPSQVSQVATEIIDSCRRPPKADGVRVIREFFSTKQVVCFKQRFCGFQLVVGVIVAVVKVCNFVVNRAHGSASFLGSCLRDDVYRPNVTLCVVTQIDDAHEAGVDQRSLKTGIWLAQNKGKYIRCICGGIVFAN